MAEMTPTLKSIEKFDWKSPNYDQVYAERSKMLANLRANPEILAKLKEFYKENPVDFITDWGMTVDPRLAEIGMPTTVPFVLFQRQEEFIDFIVDRWKGREDGLVEKSRDMGVSWLCVSIAVWMWLFHTGTIVGVGSRKEEYVDKIGDPKSLFWKARQFINMLPLEFRPKGWDDQKHAPHMRILNPENGSSIIGEAGDNIGRGNRTSIYFKDEAAFFERPDAIDAALSQTSNCKIDVSTPNGAGNPFYRKAHGGKIKKFVFDWHAQPLDAKILTPAGWRVMGDITVGDRVVSPSGKSIKILEVHPKGVKEVYRVEFNDGSSTECCGDHLWTVIPCGNQRVERRHITKIMSLFEMLDDYVKIDNRGFRQHRYQIPLTKPVECFRKVKTPLHPYVVGYLLGDGSLPTKTTSAVSMSIGPGDGEIVSLINARLPSGCSVKFGSKLNYWVSANSTYRGGVNGRGCHNPVNEAIRNLGLSGKKSHNKFIPDCYLRSSPADRLSLLQGLFDADGNVPKNDLGAAQLTTISRQLAEGTMFLAQSLGGVAKIHTRASGEEYAVFGSRSHCRADETFTVIVRLPDGMVPFLMARKAGAYKPSTRRPPRRSIVNISQVGEKLVQCITVDADDGLYLTDDMVVTHNCDPRKDQAWYDKQCEMLDSVVVAQEIDRNYESSVVNAFIPADTVLAAQARGPADVKPIGGLRVGIDVARFGDDSTVITFRRGRVLLKQVVLQGMDVAQVAGRAKNEIAAYAEKPEQIAVDTIGIGAGVADMLRAWFPDVVERGKVRQIVVDVNAAIRQSDGIHYNLRAFMWGEMREWLKTASISNDQDLKSDLTALRYLFKGGELLLESKEDAKRRGVHSPDRGDSLALTFAIPTLVRPELPKVRYQNETLSETMGY